MEINLIDIIKLTKKSFFTEKKWIKITYNSNQSMTKFVDILNGSIYNLRLIRPKKLKNQSKINHLKTILTKSHKIFVIQLNKSHSQSHLHQLFMKSQKMEIPRTLKVLKI